MSIIASNLNSLFTETITDNFEFDTGTVPDSFAYIGKATMGKFTFQLKNIKIYLT